MAIQIDRAFIEQAYRRVTTDEGSYETGCGWNVFVFLPVDQDGGRKIYAYRGATSEELPLPMPQNRAETLLQRVEATGEINPQYWTWIGSDHPEDLPDYALNPHRPEYN